MGAVIKLRLPTRKLLHSKDKKNSSVKKRLHGKLKVIKKQNAGVRGKRSQRKNRSGIH